MLLCQHDAQIALTHCPAQPSNTPPTQVLVCPNGMDTPIYFQNDTVTCTGTYSLHPE